MDNILEIELENREDLIKYLSESEHEYTIIKFKAEWCNPCKKIAPFIESCVKSKEEEFKNEKKKFLFITLDVDECFDLYAFLKKIKMINGIPALFLYSKKNLDEERKYIPQYNISGTNEQEIRKMFNIIK